MRREDVRKQRLGLLGLLIAGYGLQLISCGPWDTVRKFSPVPKEDQLTMFGQYKLHLYGSSYDPSDTCTFFCEPSFVGDVPVSTPLDSVPIFVVDSICLEGACLSAGNCYVLTSYDDWDRQMDTLEGMPQKRKWEPRPNPDITWDEKQFRPLGYLIPGGIVLPLACDTSDVSVLIVARLYDRATRQEIARELKKIPFSTSRITKYRNSW